MKKRKISELEEDIKQLEAQDQYLVQQIVREMLVADQVERKLQDLEWQRESIRTMLLEDEAELDELVNN